MKLLILTIAFIASSFAAPSLRITNGEDAEQDQFPYQVSVQMISGSVWQHACGGAILNENTILTAGHCISRTTPIAMYRVVAGILDLSILTPNSQIIEVAQAIIHPDYQEGVGPNDIGILKLSETLQWNSSVQKIDLPGADAVFFGDSVLSGWGSTSTGGTSIMPNRLQTAIMPILSYQECASTLIALVGSSSPLDEATNVCSGPLTGITSCTGDSGGPLVQDGKVIGVVSWGIKPCGYNGAPSVHTKVSAFIDFINQHM